MLAWLIPALAFVVAIGLVGVGTKMALAGIHWTELVIWTAIFYAIIATVVWIAGGPLDYGIGTGFGIATAIMAPLTVMLLFVSIDAGDVSRVIPVGAAYPAVTVVGAAIFLGEPFTPQRILGTALVIIGVILVSTEIGRRKEVSQSNSASQ